MKSLLEQDWKVLADPVPAGKHPCHDSRYIATADAEWNHTKEWDFENEDSILESGSLICALRDIPEQAEIAKVLASVPLLRKLLRASHRVISAMDADLCKLGRGRDLYKVPDFEGYNFPAFLAEHALPEPSTASPSND